jgi:hypothetical protein
MINLISLKERVAIADAFTPEERDFVLGAINTVAVSVLTRVVAHDPGNYMGRIDRIWAFLSLDDGGEGVMGAPLDGGTVPLIAADKRRLDDLIPLARRLATRFGKPIRLAKFSKRDVDIYQP